MADSMIIYEASVVAHEGTTYALARLANGEKQLVVEGETPALSKAEVAVFHGAPHNGKLLCSLTPENAAALRTRLPWLNPVPLGVRTSFGFGDRIGLATPGHVAALAAVGGHIAPIFAQQSVRENTRIGRTPQQVIDDAMWGIFETGWRGDWGADADHVKEISHVTPFVQAGYTFYTIDPSDHVDNDAQTDDLETLRRKSAQLPWQQFDATLEALVNEYCAAPVALDGVTLHFDEEVLLRALAKYGLALAHTLSLTAEIRRQLGGKPFDLEMSVDETDTPTSAEEHYFIANELLKQDVPVVSLAPRFVGKFQKGVDYMGDLAEFESELAKHAAIMRHFDSYKLSIHTGSDKFTIYGLINQHANGRVHVKTAGTSYLEALRVISRTDTALFRQILDLGHERFATDRKTYFIDCRPENVPAGSQLADADLPALLDDFDARQLLHVTFGSALDEYGAALKRDILSDEAAYEAVLVTHFGRHLRPFC
ncbi:MAG: tagaturonate epimerase family protein [Chloroflexota bacterium]